MYLKPKTTEKSTNNSLSPANTLLNQSKTSTQSKSQSNLNNFVEPNHVTTAEIIWCLKCVKQHWSFNSMSDISKLFQLMFPGTAAVKFSPGKEKKVCMLLIMDHHLISLGNS